MSYQKYNNFKKFNYNRNKSGCSYFHINKNDFEDLIELISLSCPGDEKIKEECSKFIYYNSMRKDCRNKTDDELKKHHLKQGTSNKFIEFLIENRRKIFNIDNDLIKKQKLEKMIEMEREYQKKLDEIKKIKKELSL